MRMQSQVILDGPPCIYYMVSVYMYVAIMSVFILLTAI